MAVIDIDALLAPVSEEAPAGENMEYGVVAEVERLATGNPGKLDPETREMIGAEEPEWRKVRDAALAAFSQTKDLRIAVILTRALLAVYGLQGLGAGMELISRMTSTYWDTVHPRLDPDEGDDPVERLNALGNLDDPDQMLRALRGTRIVESREAGSYTIRDLDMVAGRLPVPDGTQAPSMPLLAASWNRGDAQANADRRAAVQAGVQSLDDMIKLFRDKTNDSPSFDNVRQMLKRVRDFYDEVAPAEVEEEGEESGGEEGGDTSAKASGSGGGAKAGGALASRADAIKTLQQIAQFLRKTEPSSPAPMFIDRAVKILQSDFATIIKDLMPESKDRIEMLGGISLDSE